GDQRLQVAVYLGRGHAEVRGDARQRGGWRQVGQPPEDLRAHLGGLHLLAFRRLCVVAHRSVRLQWRRCYSLTSPGAQITLTVIQLQKYRGAPCLPSVTSPDSTTSSAARPCPAPCRSVRTRPSRCPTACTTSRSPVPPSP